MYQILSNDHGAIFLCVGRFRVCSDCVGMALVSVRESGILKPCVVGLLDYVELIRSKEIHRLK